jgi:serine O-acetyltransferase
MVMMLHEKSMETYEIVLRQLNSFWPTVVDKQQMMYHISHAIEKTIASYDVSNTKYYLQKGFSVLNSTVYAVFLYHLSHEIGLRGGSSELADKLYYLNKIMNCVEWYWNIELPEHFVVEHPVGTVLGKATYGDYLCVFQGVTIGANFREKECLWPVIGNHVTLYANSSVIGNCHIGNNVIIAANAFLFNEIIQDNSVVYGSSPELVVRNCTEEENRKMMIRMWKSEP